MKKNLAYLVAITAVVLIAIYFGFFSKSSTTSDNSSRATKRDDTRTLSQLRWLDSADVERDFKNATSKNDFRFIGLYRYAPYVPGIPPSDDSLVHTVGVRYIEGTSDALLSKEHTRLDSLAEQYATQYNQLMLHHLKRGKAH